MGGVVEANAFVAVEYDYIVVGGGTAGTALATRLSEDQSVTVGLIEAGQWLQDDDKVDIPGLFGSSLGLKEYDWTHSTVPLRNVDNRVIPVPRGRALGGTSVIHSMGMARAPADEYDELEELGNPGWNWKGMTEFFKRTETIHPAEEEFAHENFATFDPEFNGLHGPIHKSFVPWLGETHPPFFKAINALGVKTNTDAASGRNKGVFTMPATIDPSTGKRCSSVAGYYAPNASRKNLYLVTGAQATKVVLEDTKDGKWKATGVEFVWEGRSFVARARREVVLCAGAIQTPQLLELSGIGDRVLLERFQIPVKIDLPAVGENYQDHLLVPSTFEARDNLVTLDCLHDPEFAREQMELYKTSKKGMYASIHSAFAGMSIDEVLSPEQIKDALDGLDSSEWLSKASGGLKKQLDIQRKWLEDKEHVYFEVMHVPEYLTNLEGRPPREKRYVSILSVLMHPFSRGSIHITSSDPLCKPSIDPNYFDRDIDLKLLIHCLRFSRKLARTEPLASYVTALTHPSENVQTDEQFAEFIRKNLETAHHHLGTASMLPKEDGGVVDASLKVYGTTNLRIADASIIPLQLSAHPQATIYAIAEKAASIIRDARSSTPNGFLHD